MQNWTKSAWMVSSTRYCVCPVMVASVPLLSVAALSTSDRAIVLLLSFCAAVLVQRRGCVLNLFGNAQGRAEVAYLGVIAFAYTPLQHRLTLLVAAGVFLLLIAAHVGNQPLKS